MCWTAFTYKLTVDAMYQGNPSTWTNCGQYYYHASITMKYN